jgi:hypothetical protein
VGHDVLVLIVALLAQISGATHASGAKAPDACALVADADVRAVLGVTVKERRPGTQEARGLLLTQCYLGTGTSQSVSIAVAGQTKSGNKLVTPRAFWRDQFHARVEDAGDRRSDHHDAAENGGADRAQDVETAARPIAGVGDEAFWSGSRVAGALYALRGNTFIRVSVGGIGDEADRIEKSRRLAIAALARLP